MSRSIHLVLPNADGEHVDRSVVKSLAHGHRYIDLAIELWRLAGDPVRAARVEQIAELGYARDNYVLYNSEVAEMRSLLLGLEEALKRSIIDSDSRILPNLLADVRSRSKLLAIEESRGDLARDAVGEAIGDVASLEAFLEEATERKLEVSLD